MIPLVAAGLYVSPPAVAQSGGGESKGQVENLSYVRPAATEASFGGTRRGSAHPTVSPPATAQSGAEALKRQVENLSYRRPVAAEAPYLHAPAEDVARWREL